MIAFLFDEIPENDGHLQNSMRPTPTKKLFMPKKGKVRLQTWLMILEAKNFNT